MKVYTEKYDANMVNRAHMRCQPMFSLFSMQVSDPENRIFRKNNKSKEFPLFREALCDLTWTLNEGTPWQNEMRYCPKCGAYMIEGEDEE